jgi:hypothetical protein
VFALGAILCEILTGQPPYRRGEATTAGNLTGAFQRLEALQQGMADAELVALAKRCLARDPGERPRNAGEVAEALRAYDEGKQRRQRETELQSKANEIKAQEAVVQANLATKVARWRQQALRLVGALALVLLTLVVGATVSAWFFRKLYYSEKDAREFAEQQRRTAERLSANLAMEEGLALCRNREVSHGMLLLGRSLILAKGAAAEDLEGPIRANLAYWSQHPGLLRAFLRHGGGVGAVTFNRDGTRVLTASLDGTAQV